MKTLFKTLSIISTVIALTSCGTLTHTSEQKQQIAESIQNSIENKDFEFQPNIMNPMRGRTRHVTGYSVRVQGDTLISNLPYFGVAHSAPYGGGTGLSFESEIESYTSTQVADDHYEIKLTTRSEGDLLTYTFDIFTSGNAQLSVYSRNKDSISYTGEMVVEDNE